MKLFNFLKRKPRFEVLAGSAETMRRVRTNITDFSYTSPVSEPINLLVTLPAAPAVSAKLEL